MLRIGFTVLALSLLGSPAGAAVKTSEKGVTIWRGEAQEIPAPPSLKSAAPCAKVTVAVRYGYYPVRRLRTHGFWSGEDYVAAYQATTQGFYADRMAAGL